ncbi:S8 family peptidase [Streptomyces sp. N2-109]|uniref:S8 family peptidase n=1 Tax=Streptomyces gossypii TaxID=2883101 RepID=A0ABT2JXM2_9ACTN|nr:S8 family peptidase [Streptomyces gossypii]MCT2592648.1 S8 family peptidase [Streptomyces gossypii]
MQHAKRTKKRTKKTSRIVLATAAALALLSGTAAGASALEPGTGLGEIRGAGEPGAISGEYIVVMKQTGKDAPGASRLKSAPSVRSLAGDLLKKSGASGAEVERTYATALKGFSVTADETAARRLAADPAVAYVEPNRIEQGDATQADPTWGIDRVDQRDLPLSDSYTYDTDASNVTAYVVDSGVRLSHSEFGGRVKSGHDFVDDDATAQDCHGHGTHVAGTVAGRTYGVAKSVKLVAVRVLNCENRGTTADVLAGYDWVAKNHVKPAVANISIGGSATDAKDAAVTAMVRAGVTVAVSAGNNDVDACEQSPARAPAVLTVAATTSTDARWVSSNHGTCVDLFAPGYRVVSAGLSSDTANAVFSGTSMAAPHVTGAAALRLAEHPTETPAQVSSALLDASTEGRVRAAGTGSPNKLLYSRF